LRSMSRNVSSPPEQSAAGTGSFISGATVPRMTNLLLLVGQQLG